MKSDGTALILSLMQFSKATPLESEDKVSLQAFSYTSSWIILSEYKAIDREGRQQRIWLCRTLSFLLKDLTATVGSMTPGS